MPVLKTVQVVGVGGLMVINESDLEQYKAQGYKLATPPDTEKPDEKPAKKAKKE